MMHFLFFKKRGLYLIYMHHLSEAATDLEFYWLGADILVLCITVLFDKALDSSHDCDCTRRVTGKM
jgi:hypothetical protein